MDIEASGLSSTDNPPPRPKRSRVLLSCGPCRNSKLKCDRGQPCQNCLKKDRIDLCLYAPKPNKSRPAKGVAARLKRLEGMVRGMMDADGNAVRLPPGLMDLGLQSQSQGSSQGQRRLNGKLLHETTQTPPEEMSGTSSEVTGSLVQGDNATTYVGATHCMAMLEDIEELKEMFDYPDDESDEGSPHDGFDDAEDWMLFSNHTPKDRGYLLRQLPDKQIMGRLIQRYFASMSPSQHVVHRPTFTKAYARFCRDENSVSYHWLAQLFMILALGTFFSRFQSPNEDDVESTASANERIKQYRACAGWALVWGRFLQPTFRTLPAFLLYCESHFLLNRAAQMNCYVLSGVLMRLMLKMGLHRDPSKLANVRPFEGEMRRRIWNMGTQLETVVSFHMGLPSMISGIESDVTVPHNFHDEDLDEDCTELPPERPHSDWTVMTYPIYKTKIIQVFDRIGRQAHALKPPAYADVQTLDTELNAVYRSMPSFMFVRSLDESAGDAPALLIQRFGLASLFHKSRCVLHRRYLAEQIPKREHDFSRQQCLDGALTLLDIQDTIWSACKPGHVLGQNGWFASSLAVHDYLLAAMVVYLTIQNEYYNADDAEHAWKGKDGVSPSKEELKGLLRRSYNIWSLVAEDVAELRKTADTLAIMLSRLGCPVAGDGVEDEKLREASSQSWSDSSVNPRTDNSGSDQPAFPPLGQTASDSMYSSSDGAPPPFLLAQALDGSSMHVPEMGLQNDMSSMMVDDTAWMTDVNCMDWRFLDVSLAHSQTAGLNAEPGAGATFMERFPNNGMGNVNLSEFGWWDNEGQNTGMVNLDGANTNGGGL